MKIIKAQKKHIPQIRKLFSVMDTKKWSVSSLPKIKKDFERTYVVIEKKKIVGAMSLHIDKHNCEIVTLRSILPGTGRKLVEFAEKKAREAKKLKLWCWSAARFNTRGFYHKMGFEEQFLLKKHFYNEDCWLFGKLLSPSKKKS